MLCFPFLFRGALDVGAREINDAMKVAAVKAIADLATAESSDIVAKAYRGQNLHFGPDYLIPKPFDPRLITEVAPAVARRPIADMERYVEHLTGHVYRTGFAMKPLFDHAREAPRRVLYAEGDDDRVLQAVQIALDDGLARPILVGRRRRIEERIEGLGLRFGLEKDADLIDLGHFERYDDYVARYHAMMARRGVSPDRARTLMGTSASLIGAMALLEGDADAMICGTAGGFDRHLQHIMDVIGRKQGVGDAHALELLILDSGSVVICDTAVSEDPSVDQLIEMTLLAADQVRRFGIEPKVALLSHSDFGAANDASAEKMRRAVTRLRELAPDLEIEGEMRADTALDPIVRERIFPAATLKGAANLLVMPSLGAANIAFNMARVLGDGISVGPMLIGMAKPAHIVGPAITVRGLVNMTAIAVVDAQQNA